MPRLGLPNMAALKLVGRVVSNGEMSKTAKVLVTRTFEHSRTGKHVSKRKKFMVHDEEGERLAGDIVRIQNCRPISKLKKFEIVEVLKEAERIVDPLSGQTKTAYADALLKSIPKKKHWQKHRGGKGKR